MEMFWLVYVVALLLSSGFFCLALAAYLRPRRPTRRSAPIPVELDGRCTALLAQRLVAPRQAFEEALMLLEQAGHRRPAALSDRDDDAEFEAILFELALLRQRRAISR